MFRKFDMLFPCRMVGNSCRGRVARISYVHFKEGGGGLGSLCDEDLGPRDHCSTSVIMQPTRYSLLPLACPLFWSD